MDLSGAITPEDFLSMEVIVFDRDDDGFLTWMIEHPEGFVLNAKRINTSPSCSLHRSGCAHIRILRNSEGPGGLTDRSGIKVCSGSMSALVDHAALNRRTPVLKITSCRSCDPGLSDVLVERMAEEISTIFAPTHSRVVPVNKYEQDVVGRAICFGSHGFRCKVCDVDLERTYGILGKGAMFVHHTVPMAFLNDDYLLDPVRDLVPVCFNCHFMLHRGREDALRVEDLRQIIRIVRNKRLDARYMIGASEIDDDAVI